MNIRFLRIFIFLMCALAAGIADAHTLHVGNKSFALSQTKYTTPSLAFGVGNETWYCPLSKTHLNNGLYVKHNNDVYVANNCADRIFTDTENYTYDENGRLIGADERLWVKNPSTGGGYIDSGFIPTGETRLLSKLDITSNTYSGFWFITRNSGTQGNFGFFCSQQFMCRSDYGNSIGTNVPSCSCKQQGIYTLDKNKNITIVYHPNGQTYRYTHQKQTFSSPATLPILAQRTSANTSPSVKNNYKIYYVKLWSNGADENTLVRNMVPVPACMKIGNFVVPENGMWDIVEQKFYGNANSTGTIIYGRDE